MSSAAELHLAEVPEVAEGGLEGPLTADHQQELAEADRRVRKILSAAKVATFNGWTAAIFAGLGLIGWLFSFSALLVGVGMSVVAWNEFRGGARVRALDPGGARLLGWNQLGLIGVITAYGLFSIYVGLTGPNPYEEQIKAHAQIAPLLRSIADLYKTLTVAVYGGVIALSIVFQGFNSRYYFKRVGMLEEHVRLTPGWILDLQRR